MQNLKSLRRKYVQIVKEKSVGKDLVIYGAGVYARKLYTLLRANNLQVKYFCVSDHAGNLDRVMGLPVKIMADWHEEELERTLFLIGIMRPAGEQVYYKLQMIEKLNVLATPRYFELILDDDFARPALEITPIAGCSVNCKYCPQEAFLTRYFSHPRQKEMSFTDFKTCIDKTPANLMIDFSGFVEPFMAKDAVKMMQYGAKLGRDMRLFTTLRGLTIEKFKEIEDIPFKMVVLHLPDVNGFAHILVTEEYMELLEMVVSKKKVNGERFVDTANCQAAPEPEVAAMLQGRVPISWSLVDRAGNLEGSELASANLPVDEEIFCSRASKLDHNVLLPNGDVVLCCMDFGMRHVLGNLLEDNYEDIMSSAEMCKVMSSLTGKGDSLCRHCSSAERSDVLK